MPTYTLYGDAADGDVYKSHATYATARQGYPGTDLTNGTSSNLLNVGQELNAGTYYCYQACIGFDTSSIVGSVTSVTLDLYISDDSSATDFTIEARDANWASAVTVADFIVGDDISTYALRASLATSGITAGQYNSFTSDSSFAANLGSSLKLTLMSSRQRTADAPVGREYIGAASGDRTPQATYAPRLTVVTALPGAVSRRRTPRGLYVR